MAQGCHASTAALWLFRDDEVTQSYCSEANLDHMHKAVLEVKGEAQLRTLSERLDREGIKHKLWLEQPENVPTCLALKPYRKEDVYPIMKKYNLCKTAIAGPK